MHYLKVRYLAVAAFWLVGICWFVASSIVSQNASVTHTPDRDIIAPVNRITDVRLFHSAPEQKGSTSFSLAFDSLTTKNGSLGLFKTALQRTVFIEGLRVWIYDKIPPDLDKDLLTDSSFSVSKVADYISLQFADYLSNSSKGQDDYNLDLGVDFRNISKLFVMDFQFDHFLSGTPDLSVQSKTAQTVPEQSGLLLRGHVIIDTHNGKKLQCNRVVWDMTDETFTAKGRFALDYNGKTRTGENIRLDRNLNEITVSQKTSMDKKEMQRCYARSQ